MPPGAAGSGSQVSHASPVGGRGNTERRPSWVAAGTTLRPHRRGVTGQRGPGEVRPAGWRAVAYAAPLGCSVVVPGRDPQRLPAPDDVGRSGCRRASGPDVPPRGRPATWRPEGGGPAGSTLRAVRSPPSAAAGAGPSSAAEVVGFDVALLPRPTPPRFSASTCAIRSWASASSSCPDQFVGRCARDRSATIATRSSSKRASRRPSLTCAALRSADATSATTWSTGAPRSCRCRRAPPPGSVRRRTGSADGSGGRRSHVRLLRSVGRDDGPGAYPGHRLAPGSARSRTPPRPHDARRLSPPRDAP
jgi:hypothetical protein